jgi:hypothetical protein
MALLKAEVCLKGIVELAQDIQREEGTHHYNLFIDDEELNGVYETLEKMRDDILDERRKLLGH